MQFQTLYFWLEHFFDRFPENTARGALLTRHFRFDEFSSVQVVVDGPEFDPED